MQRSVPGKVGGVGHMCCPTRRPFVLGVLTLGLLLVSAGGCSSPPPSPQLYHLFDGETGEDTEVDLIIYGSYQWSLKDHEGNQLASGGYSGPQGTPPRYTLTPGESGGETEGFIQDLGGNQWQWNLTTTPPGWEHASAGTAVPVIPN